MADHLLVAFVGLQCFYHFSQWFGVVAAQIKLIFADFKSKFLMRRVKLRIDTLFVAACIDPVPTIVFEIDPV